LAAAGQAGTDSRPGTCAKRALGELIQTYWFPLYAYVRRQGVQASQAEDLVQGFLTRLLEKNDLASVDREKGRFRSFLLASLKHFIANQYAMQSAIKRGGGLPTISLDALAAEARYATEACCDMTPERLFDRRWALAVLDQVLSRLGQEYARAGKANLFETIKEHLTPQRGQLSYAQSAEGLGMTAGALKVAIHRMRRRYRQLLRDEIAQTANSPLDIEEEISYLLNCL
jgi:RNA polymerase sigma factor (sigma-70 family)